MDGASREEDRGRCELIIVEERSQPASKKWRRGGKICEGLGDFPGKSLRKETEKLRMRGDRVEKAEIN